MLSNELLKDWIPVQAGDDKKDNLFMIQSLLAVTGIPALYKLRRNL